ncbi:G-type lectin S-receptor-like serine/threonine-protein kinase [Cinnamomum micranthum f. kanehirae]|uniref:G-type lectin S-receptor-like serine/threonine-protein kinase n=1 Tax=Cinnamomum micranthum f. kanehirae TaxID=337451 RepID=A0A443PBH1_9MAGN|nr:G-type lectin S-receptor-like serine/threonine-protein kinase [Cinnamomum micranthum f. kanehirae]
MSPEYAMEGRFSEKSDVFSFGVLLLEIVWRLWNDGNISAIIDPILGDLSSTTEVLRCIQVGLLCVQEFATDRPILSFVVFMLSSDIAALPTSKQPAFAERTPSKIECSINEVSITIFQGW